MTLNCPFPAGSGRKEILGAFQEQLTRRGRRSEARAGAAFRGLRFENRRSAREISCLTDADFADLTRVVREIADKHAGGRLLSVLEGGYSLTGLAAGVRAHVEALL